MAAPAQAWGEEFAVINFAAPDAKTFTEEGAYAVVDIAGPLEQHASWKADSYDAIRARMADACASEQPTVVLRINSPGGDFAGSIELARELRGMALQAKKGLIAFTDSQALSAGYILACAATEIVVTPSAFVGSIGVWAPMVDETRRDQAMGLMIAIIASGARKADSNPHVAITEDAVSAMQTQVDAMAGLFFAHVSDSRPMAMSAITGLQGASKFGQEAVSLHLADRIVNSWSEFLTSVGASQMPKSYGDHMAAHRANLEKCAEGDDEDAKAAQRDLKAWDEKEAASKAEADEEDAKKKEDADASAKAADDEDAKARAADEEKPADKAAARGGLRVVASSTPAELDFAKRLHAIEVDRANERDATARAQALSGRPDFSAEIRKSLMGASVEFVKDACKTWPRGSTPAQAAVAALTPGGTRGAEVPHTLGGEVDRNGMPKGFVGVSEEEYIDQQMSRGAAASAGVTFQGKELTLGFMTPEEARKRLQALQTPATIKDGAK